MLKQSAAAGEAVAGMELGLVVGLALIALNILLLQDQRLTLML
jgi:hypothetical protein